MGNNDLERRIINNVRNKIVVSNLETEADMKISRRKTITSVIAILLVFMSGSFLTVNAATDGQLAKDVKNIINCTFDTAKYKQTEGKEGVDDKGNKYYQYKLESLDGEEEVEIVTYKDIDTNAYYNVDYNIDEDGNATMNISATSESTGTDKK